MKNQGFIGGKIPFECPQSVNNATMQLAEMLIKRKEKFISDQLEKMGYGKDCLKRCRYTIIPVQFSVEGGDILVLVVDAVAEDVLFAFTQKGQYVLQEKEGYVEYVREVAFDLEDAPGPDSDIYTGAIETARRAREQLLEMRMMRMMRME